MRRNKNGPKNQAHSGFKLNQQQAQRNKWLYLKSGNHFIETSQRQLRTSLL
jgi:hypothetical protein